VLETAEKGYGQEPNKDISKIRRKWKYSVRNRRFVSGRKLLLDLTIYGR
jgi:hypothetical protein